LQAHVKHSTQIRQPVCLLQHSLSSLIYQTAQQ